MAGELDPKLLVKLKAITAKRPRTVIEHILKHGQITTEELRDQYGYNHPPRAARDVREEGIPLRTIKVRGSDGRSIGAYVFGDLSEIEENKLGGRRVFSKGFKQVLADENGARCEICREPYEIRYLQIDHRVPYQVAGESANEEQTSAFMLLCGSCNRAKSWSCENCSNWKSKKDMRVCQTCYWANPAEHTHVATDPVRRVDITWSGEETNEFDAARKTAKKQGLHLPEFIKRLLKPRNHTD